MKQNRGSGSELENAKKLATDLKTDNVIFYGQRPLEEMPELYKIADVMLVTLEDKPYANMTIPGKVQSILLRYKDRCYIHMEVSYQRLPCLYYA